MILLRVTWEELRPGIYAANFPSLIYSMRSANVDRIYLQGDNINLVYELVDNVTEADLIDACATSHRKVTDIRGD